MRTRYMILLGLMSLFWMGLGFAQEAPRFTLTILHSNDTHAHHEADGDGNGGAALQAAVIKQVRAENPNTLLVDTGDRFMGTLFHTLYLGGDQVQILNALDYDVVGLGKHEFNYGEDTLSDFLLQFEGDAVAANVNWGTYTTLAELVRPYTIVDVSGTAVGVIGLVNADTAFKSSVDPQITFSADYAAVVNQYADELMAQDVNIIILLSHIGIENDRTMMSQLRHVDVVVGGESQTVLSNILKSEGSYPLVVADSEGNNVYYVQAGRYNQYLGRLNVTFNALGFAESAVGDLIYLSRYISPDPELTSIVADLAIPVEQLKEQATGALTQVDLIGDRSVCRVEECDMGNLIADALRAETRAQIGLMNGGGIRADLLTGEITFGQLLEVHPFGNTIATMTLNGADLRSALENSVSRIVLDEAGQIIREGASGRFLQVSGLRYSYDPTLEVGTRIVSVDVEQADGTYAPLEDAASYRIATVNFLRTGGDGYTMFTNASESDDFGRVDFEVTLSYVTQLGIIEASLVDPANPRISIINATLPSR